MSCAHRCCGVVFNALMVVGFVAAASACNAGMITGPLELADGDGSSATGQPAARTELLSFRDTIQRDLDDAGCTSCHGNGSIPMHVVASPSSDDQWRSNYQEVFARAGSDDASPLIERGSGGEGHPALLAGDSAIARRWRSWIGKGAPYQASQAPADPTGPGPVFGDGGAPAVRRDAGSPATDAGASPPATGSLTWTTDIAPIIASHDCTRCHGDRGNYTLDSYASALGNGSDGTPNIIPGDASSTLIDYCRNGHQGISYLEALVIVNWIVDSNARE